MVCLIFLLATACQPLGQPISSTTAPEPTRIRTISATATPDERATLAAELQVSASALLGTKITFWHPLTGKSAGVLNQLVNEFNQANPYGIFVTPTPFYGDSELASGLENALTSAATLPAVILDSPDRINHWQKVTGQVVDLDLYINQPGTGLNEQQLADLFPSFFRRESNSGGKLGIPAYRSANILFYNQTWANELGFSNPPTTIEEFKQQACAAAEVNASDKKRSNDGTGGWFIDTGWPSSVSWLQAFSFNRFPDANGSDFRFSSPEGEKALAFLKSLNDQGCAWSGRKTDPQEYFATRQALFYSATLEDIGPQTRTDARLGSKDTWIPIAYPAESSLAGILSTGYDTAVFKSDARSQMAAWLFIKWLMDPARHARLAAADTTFPLSYSEVAALGTLGEQNPQWQQALGFISQVKESPLSPDWWIVRHILEDAFWKSLQPNVKDSDLPIILHELDGTISEVLGK
jgi:multiple sugar transport system substrate-binding protein